MISPAPLYLRLLRIIKQADAITPHANAAAQHQAATILTPREAQPKYTITVSCMDGTKHHLSMSGKNGEQTIGDVKRLLAKMNLAPAQAIQLFRVGQEHQPIDLTTIQSIALEHDPQETGTRETGTQETGTRETGTRETGTREHGAQESDSPPQNAISIFMLVSQLELDKHKVIEKFEMAANIELLNIAVCQLFLFIEKYKDEIIAGKQKFISKIEGEFSKRINSLCQRGFCNTAAWGGEGPAKNLKSMLTYQNEHGSHINIYILTDILDLLIIKNDESPFSESNLQQRANQYERPLPNNSDCVNNCLEVLGNNTREFSGALLILRNNLSVFPENLTSIDEMQDFIDEQVDIIAAKQKVIDKFTESNTCEKKKLAICHFFLFLRKYEGKNILCKNKFLNLINNILLQQYYRGIESGSKDKKNIMKKAQAHQTNGINPKYLHKTLFVELIQTLKRSDSWMFHQHHLCHAAAGYETKNEPGYISQQTLDLINDENSESTIVLQAIQDEISYFPERMNNIENMSRHVESMERSLLRQLTAHTTNHSSDSICHKPEVKLLSTGSGRMIY